MIDQLARTLAQSSTALLYIELEEAFDVEAVHGGSIDECYIDNSCSHTSTVTISSGWWNCFGQSSNQKVDTCLPLLSK